MFRVHSRFGFSFPSRLLVVLIGTAYNTIARLLMWRSSIYCKTCASSWSKPVAPMAEFRRVFVEVLSSNLYTKGRENNLSLVCTKKTVLVLIFGLLQPLPTNSAKLLQYSLMFRKTKVCHLIELKWTEFTQILKHIYRYSEWNWQKVCFEHHFIYLQGVLSFIQENSFEMKGITYRGRKYYHSMIVIYKPVTGKNTKTRSIMGKW